jgi:alpha-glucosidase
MKKEQTFLWWQTGVVYQIYPRSYQDSNDDGIGDLNGIIQRLDYLSETLGVEAIWLSPFYPSPMADFGYDVSDYQNVDPMFGTLEDFDRLVAEAHQRNLRVVIDFVPNHTSDQHPWFIESRSSRDNPKRDWYFWRDAKPDGSLPNNWLSLFGGKAWEFDEKTGQYYLHIFLKEQPDLNWRNPETKAAMLSALQFWLERGVDGFRLDVAHFIMKDPELRDNPPNPDIRNAEHPAGEYPSQLHIHDIAHPDVHGVFREIRQLLDSYSMTRPRYSVGEIHLFDWKKWAKYYGENLDELHMPFNFAFIRHTPWQPKAIRAVVDGVEAALPPGAWPNYVMGNHDEPRLASRFGKEQVRVAAMLLLTLRGTPTLYQGDELGMENVDIPIELQKDPFGLRVPGSGRDLCRTPMQWTPAENAGFASPSVKAWLPLSPKYKTENVADELKDPTSVLNLYRKLLALRRDIPALHRGSYTPAGETTDDCFSFWREAEGVRFLITLNFSGNEIQPVVGSNGKAAIRLATGLDRSGLVNLETLILKPHEGLILEMEG